MAPGGTGRESEGNVFIGKLGYAAWRALVAPLSGAQAEPARRPGRARVGLSRTAAYSVHKQRRAKRPASCGLVYRDLPILDRAGLANRAAELNAIACHVLDSD